MRLAPCIAVLVALATASSRAPAAEPETPAPAPLEKPAAEPPAASPAEETAPDPERGTTSKDESQINTTTEEKESALPFRNSTFIFDQSTSTQTAHLETSPQLTYVPVYEWWLSFRPRYYFSDKVFVRLRFDYFKDFTNDEQTTYYRENVFGDTWADLVYDTRVPAISKYTKMSAGVRLRFPTSKASQDQGEYVDTGVTAGIKQKIPIRGESARFLSDAHVAAGAWYDHPWTRATTPTNPNLDYTREDTGGQSFLSDQLPGVTLVDHRLLVSLDAGLQITTKLALNLDMILLNEWHYAPTANQCVATLTGCAPVNTTPGFGTTYVADTWFLASIDYDLLDELTLTLGYYNLTNEIAPDGQRRGLFGSDNIWWSPSARVFFDVTVNLDDVYEWASGNKTTKPENENRRVQTAGSGTALGGLGL